ncbi:MAG: hypothetical protein FJW38_30780, partial [Acidobacteria bacterium]|nr:hypothetical protein [Acidobacteriota bacterium]
MSQAALINLALLLLFALQHSVMARPFFKQRFRARKPRRTYVLATFAALALIWRFWQPMPDVLWLFKGATAFGFYAIWTFGLQLILFGALAINWRELLGIAEPGPPAFVTPFLYTIVRHPIYLGARLWCKIWVDTGLIPFRSAGLDRSRPQSRNQRGSPDLRHR